MHQILFQNMLLLAFIFGLKHGKKTEETATKVRAIADGAALSTGARVKVERFQNEVKDFVINETFDDILKKRN